MSNRATLTLETLESGLRFRARAGSGQSTVVDSGPGMQSPSPVEMMLIALAGCGAMDVISILRKKRQVVLGYDVDVTGERRADHPRAFTRIEVVHRLRGRNLNPDAIEEAIRLSDTKYCSVHASMDRGIEILTRYEIIPE